MKKILIADDSYGWREFHITNLKEIFLELEIDDYKLDIANSAKEGYEFIMQNNNSPYDLVITDLQMEEDFSPKYAGEWLIYSADYIPKRVAVANINNYKDKIIEYMS